MNVQTVKLHCRPSEPTGSYQLTLQIDTEEVLSLEPHESIEISLDRRGSRLQSSPDVSSCS